MSKRREYLGVLATGLTAAVGGCLDDSGAEPTDDEPADTSTGEPTETDTADETATEGPGETETDDAGETTLQGRIDSTGSSTVFPLAQAVATRFEERAPAVSISIAATGTGGGFTNQFCTGGVFQQRFAADSQRRRAAVYRQRRQVPRAHAREGRADGRRQHRHRLGRLRGDRPVPRALARRRCDYLGGRRQRLARR